MNNCKVSIDSVNTYIESDDHLIMDKNAFVLKIAVLHKTSTDLARRDPENLGQYLGNTYDLRMAT